MLHNYYVQHKLLLLASPEQVTMSMHQFFLALIAFCHIGYGLENGFVAIPFCFPEKMKSFTVQFATPKKINDQAVFHSVIFEPSTKTELKCKIEDSKLHTVLQSKDIQTYRPNTRNFINSQGGSDGSQNYSTLTASGHFYENRSGYYYRPDGDYCIHS